MKWLVWLDDGQTYAVDFLIDVQRIDVGHAADIVNYGHHSVLKVLVLDVVLTRKSAYQLFAVEFLWSDGLSLIHI